MSSPAFHFRLATLDDAPALLSIYAPYVEKTAISFEYDVPSLDEFRRRIADISRKYPYLVAEDENGQFLGYAYTHTFIARKAYDHCAESTIYLALDARKHGLGKRFYRAIEELSLAQNIYNLYACIGEPQGADDEYLTDNSIRFHEHMGFRLDAQFFRYGVEGGARLIGTDGTDGALVQQLHAQRLQVRPLVQHVLGGKTAHGASRASRTGHPLPAARQGACRRHLSPRRGIKNRNFTKNHAHPIDIADGVCYIFAQVNTANC